MGKFLSSNLNFTVNLGGNLFLTRHSHDGVQALKRCLLHALVVWLHRRTRFGKLIVRSSGISKQVYNAAVGSGVTAHPCVHLLDLRGIKCVVPQS